MVGSDSHTGSDVKFEYSWAIVREIDRINRKSQAGITLDARIHKLRAMAEPFLRTPGGKLKDGRQSWLNRWEKLGTGGDELPRAVRWQQLRMLVQLFHEEGVFFEDGISYARINYMEMNNE